MRFRNPLPGFRQDGGEASRGLRRAVTWRVRREIEPSKSILQTDCRASERTHTERMTRIELA